MDKASETSMDMLKLAAGILFFAAILVLVLKSVNIGTGMFWTSYNKIEEVEVKAERSNLASLNNTTIKIPGGSVYALLIYNEKNIGAITSYLNADNGRKYTVQDNLLDKLKGDINITVTLNKNTGLYDIALKE